MRSQLLTLRVAQHSSRRSQSLAELLSIELSHRPLVKILSCLSPAHRFVPYCRQDTSEFDFLLHRTRKEEWPGSQQQPGWALLRMIVMIVIIGEQQMRR